MELGNKILELRKEKRLSQEQLAEKINVTRQTISNWELGETSPDLNQAKELAKVLNISLDELVGNEINNIMLQKVSTVADNTSKIKKIVKVILIIIAIMFLFNIISGILYANVGKTSGGSVEFTCEYNGEEEDFYFEYVNDDFKITDYKKSSKLTEIVKDIKKYKSISDLENDIESYYQNIGGTCY